MFKSAMKLAAVAVLAGGVSANAAVIDDFTANTNQSISQTGVGTAPTVTQSGIPTGNTIGGERQMDLQVTTSDLGLDSSANVVTSNGILAFNNASGNISVATLTYGGLGGADLTDAGLSTHFQAQLTADVSGLVMRVYITDTDGDTANFIGQFNTTAFVNEAFSDFINASQVSFNSVDDIVIELTGPSDIDATLTLLESTDTPQVVPTPAALPAGALLLGVIAFRRRR